MNLGLDRSLALLELFFAGVQENVGLLGFLENVVAADPVDEPLQLALPQVHLLFLPLLADLDAQFGEHEALDVLDRHVGQDAARVAVL